MATIDQPTPSNSKSPQPEQQPLQPGGPVVSRPSPSDPKRPISQTPKPDRDKK